MELPESWHHIVGVEQNQCVQLAAGYLLLYLADLAAIKNSSP
jgi:hypothetical protein